MPVFQSNIFQNNVFQGPHSTNSASEARTVFVLSLPTTGRGLLFRDGFDVPVGGSRLVEIPSP
jgi:hypothetical protein